MAIKVAIDNNVLGYLGETEITIKKSVKSLEKQQKELMNLKYAYAFATLVCSNPRIKGVIPLLVSYEFRNAPIYVKKRVLEQWADCFYWSNNITIYKKARSLKIPPTLQHIKSSDIKIVYEASKLGCRYLVTFNKKDLRKQKNKNLIKSEFKRKFKITPPEILTPCEFINLLYLPKN